MRPLWQTGGGETFPGEASWRRQADMRLERVFAPTRAAIVLFTALLWFWLIRPRMGASPAMWALLAASITWVASEAVMARRGTRPLQRAPYLSVLLGGLMVIGWVAATGGGRSPFLPLLFVGLATAPSRLGLSLVGGLGVTVAYAAASIGFAGFAHGLWMSYALLLVGVLLVLRNRMLHDDRRVGVRDALTGCFARWYAEFLLAEWMSRGRLPLSLALIDLDGFKVVNDRYGHTAGDRVLMGCSRVLAAHLGPDDVLARYGGDEFVALLPGKGRAEAQALAARLRRALRETPMPMPDGGQPVHVATSVGVAEAAPGQEPADLVAAADRDLYRAKDARSRPDGAAEGTGRPPAYTRAASAGAAGGR